MKLKEDRNSVHLNSACFSKRKYDEVIEKVTRAKQKVRNKLPSDYHLLKKYDVLQTEGSKRLILPLKGLESNIIYYVQDDELFDILLETHLSLDHGGRDKMMKVLKQTYKNITYKDIMIFLNLCKYCMKKHKREKKEVLEKPTCSNELNSVCQLDLIDFQSHPDNEFKFIMVYQEKWTKFCILKPLKSNQVDEVANNLIDIFTTMGAPVLLQSNKGNEFVNALIDNLKVFWSTLQITHVKYEQNTVSTNQEIENMVTTWMRNNLTSKWSEGLRFIQLKKNTTFHPAINKSPYEALFKRSLKVDLNTPKSTQVEDIEKDFTKPETMWKTEPLDQDEYEEYNTNSEQIEEDGMMEIYKEEDNICQICGNDTDQNETICSMCEEN
ncbi:hypothetical protein BDFB_001407 [Asbolus verrucosus]|uniref:Integrase catalytic domain-containing protein n=1 Tax=Asbolus verrucosus TaxID=1661398 RepID=A0A482VAL3_ASBVE|nr:hypothetical protein BDFB_001407 [Asbolus verrucosus]